MSRQVKLKGETPYISRGDLRQHLKSHPLTDEERARFLLRNNIQNKDTSKEGLSALMREVVELLEAKQKCNSVKEQCDAAVQSTANLIGNINFELKWQDYVLKDMHQTQALIRELDFCD